MISNNTKNYEKIYNYPTTYNIFQVILLKVKYEVLVVTRPWVV